METETELAAAPLEAPPAKAAVRTVFAGVAGAVDTAQVEAKVAMLAAEAGSLGSLHGDVRFVLAYPGAESTHTAADPAVELLTYPMPVYEGPFSPWGEIGTAQLALLRQASEAGAEAAVLLHPDLTALIPGSLEGLLKPVLAREADLVLGNYAVGPFDALLNSAILAPLARALYGRRARFPLAPDFAVSARLAARLAMHTHRPTGGAALPLLWPATAAAGMDAAVLEAPLPMTHALRAGDMELSVVITQLVGSAFAEMESHAPLWQRVRAATQPGPSSAARVRPTEPQSAADASPIDTAPMINSFMLGSRSLQDVWGMLLPPVTLLDLKRLTLLPADRFHMPDELWVRIVYDFALGYRLRTINRTHLLGALTPLYLGWVASYVNKAAEEPGFDADRCAERLAAAFEAGKPYLVRRWRWPDRFNP